MLKKVIALLLVLCMALSIAACDKKEPNKNDQPVSTTAPTDATEPSDAPTTDPYEDDEWENEYTGNVTVAETVVYDKNDIKITCTGVSVEWDTIQFKFLVENNTEKSICVDVDTVIVNGVTTYGFFNTEVAAGKKAVEALEIYEYELAYADIDGLDGIGYVEIPAIDILDGASWDTIDTFGAKIETSIVNEVAGSEGYNISGEALYEDDYISVIYQENRNKVNDGDLECMLVLSNKANDDLYLTVDDVSANGYMLNNFEYMVLYAETVRYLPLTVYEMDLEDLDVDIAVEDIEEICFSVMVDDENNWETLVETGELTISIKNDSNNA